MSHGGENGIIYTDHIPTKEKNHTSREKGRKVSSMAAFESYTTKEVFSALRRNQNLKKCLKAVVIQVYLHFGSIFNGFIYIVTSFILYKIIYIFRHAEGKSVRVFSIRPAK
jgi:hypothetical protein